MPTQKQTYLFCGVGGSGMSAIAVAVLAKGHTVYGSDRNYDRGLFSDHYQNLIEKGVVMVPQDGSGVTANVDAVIVSSAIEASIPDVSAAQDKGVPIIKRATLLAELANQSQSICIGGTNGKSTITGMIGWILADNGLDPTILNGGGMLNFDRENAVIGQSDIMALETDESDGSITQFHADVAVLSNISEDHKDIDELKSIFSQFLDQSRHQVLNLDCPNVATLAIDYPNAHTYTMDDIPDELNLMIPGKHNISNALAAIKAVNVMGVETRTAVQSLNQFNGITSRLEVIGQTGNGITIIDDFGHNPDKIAASLQTLKQQERRLVLMYQPHGFGPLKKQKDELMRVFDEYIGENDFFYMPEAFYAGGTADKTVSSREIIEFLLKNGKNAHFFERKDDVFDEIVNNTQPNDIICIMGARDDGLREMARNLYKALL